MSLSWPLTCIVFKIVLIILFSCILFQVKFNSVATAIGHKFCQFSNSSRVHTFGNIPSKMGEVDQLKAALAQFTNDFQQLQAKVQQQPVAKSVHVVDAPQKLSKFDGKSDQLEDWLLEAKSAVEAQSLTGKQAGDFLLNHLEGPSKLEIKYAGDRDDPDKIYDLLNKAFGDKTNKIQCFDNFTARKQGDRESLQDFSLALMKLLEKAKQKDPNCVADSDKALRDNFAEKVNSDQLRWELTNRIADDPMVTFNTIRERAYLYACEVPSTSKPKAANRAVRSETADWQHSLMSLLEKQGEQQKLILKQQNQLFTQLQATKSPVSPNHHTILPPIGRTITQTQGLVTPVEGFVDLLTHMEGQDLK